MCQKTYRESAEVVTTCPDDNDLVLFVNDDNLAVFRTWAKMKACMGVPQKPLIGVVGDGGANDPVAGQSTFQSDDLIGLGVTNQGRIMILIDATPMFNFGAANSFDFDSLTGTIDLGSNTFVNGSGLYVDRNQ